MTSRDENSADNRSEQAADKPGAEGSPTKEPFERWLDTKLKNVYGSVLAEPIPDDLINLLREKLDK